MFYFAYGSNMHPGQMAKRCPGCAFVATARLKDHRLTFSRFWSAWGGGGVADIQPAPGSVVEGVVWEITEAHRQTLDEYEDYPTSYTRKDVVVEIAEGGTLTAFAYLAKPTGAYRPSRRYLDEIIEGAKVQKLSPEYVAFLESFAEDVNVPGSGKTGE
jgi:gamma-glutamylcyclotransferase (GGCT)/AIG2-like uncharacterized protein YtfP